MHRFLIPICIGLFAGFLSRLLLIQTSYRQFPSRPHGLIIHLFLGTVASMLGALVVPAIIKPDFTAGVFVSIGTAQFHSMRGLERQAWVDLDKGEVVPRGSAYIDGMAAAFEARIFLVFGVAALTTLVTYLLHWPTGAAVGLILSIVIRVWKQGRTVADLASVSAVPATLDGNRIVIDSQTVLIIPDTAGAEPLDVAEVLGIVVEPRDLTSILTLAHHGQQQAILHNLAVAVGVQTHAAFKPAITYFPKRKKLIIALLPVIRDSDVAVCSVAGSPILEGVYRRGTPKTAVQS